MAEYAMDLGSGLPIINQEVIMAARLEHRTSPEHLQLLAQHLAREQTPIWDDINAAASKEAAGDPNLRDKFIKFGLSIVSTVERAGFAEQLDAMVTDTALTEEPHVTAEKPRGRVRAWLIGSAAVVLAGGKVIKPPRWVKDSEHLAQ